MSRATRLMAGPILVLVPTMLSLVRQIFVDAGILAASVLSLGLAG